MKMKILSPRGKARKGEKVLDINGNECSVEDCEVTVVMNFMDDKVKKSYIPIIDYTKAPKDTEYTYIVDFGARGRRTSKKGVVAWIKLMDQWMIAERGQSFIDVLHIEEGTVTSSQSLYDPYITVEAISGKGERVYIIDHDTALILGYVPSKSDNRYHSPSLKSTSKDLWIALNRKSSFQLPIRTTHHADTDNECFNRVVELFKKQEYEVLSKETKYMSRLLGGKTFGIEYEVVEGTIPSPMLGALGVTALTDGSIGRDNYEITTVPLEGTKGLEAVRAQCEVLTNQAKINSNCALHIHVGNVSNDKLTFIAMYALFQRLQSDIYACHPYYKQYEIGTLGKSKEYSRTIPDLGLKRNSIFEQQGKESFTQEVNKWHKVLFEFFACTEESKDYNRGRALGKSEIQTLWGQKWHCPTRYYWANFINYLFSKTGTIEFRVHEPTTNFTKVSNFLLLCVSLIRYAERYPERILQYEKKITLDDVINELRTNFTGSPIRGKYGAYCNEIADYMLNYVKEREGIFTEQLNRANKESALNRNNAFGLIGSFSKDMMKSDAGFVFEFNGRRTIY